MLLVTQVPMSLQSCVLRDFSAVTLFVKDMNCICEWIMKCQYCLPNYQKNDWGLNIGKFVWLNKNQKLMCYVN